MGGGGGSHQSTTQMATTTQMSTTDASKHYDFNIQQQGLSAQATDQLIGLVRAQQGQMLYSQLGAAAAGSGPFSPIVMVALIILFAAIIFR